MKKKRPVDLIQKYRLHKMARQHGKVDFKKRTVFVSVFAPEESIIDAIVYVSVLHELAGTYGYNIQTEIPYTPKQSPSHDPSIQQSI